MDTHVPRKSPEQIRARKAALQTLLGMLVVAVLYGSLLCWLVHVRHPSHPILLDDYRGHATQGR